MVYRRRIFELCAVHGQNEVSYAKVTGWIKKFKTGCDSLYDAQKPERPYSATASKMVEKVCDVVKYDVSISAASVFRILKRNLKMRRISARWIPHLLSDKQKHVRLETVKSLLKMFPKNSRKQFSDIVTGDETWDLA